MTIKKTNKGVQGDWILIQPERVESMLPTDDLIQRGEVLQAGPRSIARPGDIVIVKDWMREKIVLGDVTSYYFPGASVIHIL